MRRQNSLFPSESVSEGSRAFLQQSTSWSTGTEGIPFARLDCHNRSGELAMVAPFQGGCRCGAIRYEVSSEPLAVMNCYCRDCQYASGGGFSTGLPIPTAH